MIIEERMLQSFIVLNLQNCNRVLIYNTTQRMVQKILVGPLLDPLVHILVYLN